MKNVTRVIDCIVKIVCKYGECGATSPSYHGTCEVKVPEELVKSLKRK